MPTERQEHNKLQLAMKTWWIEKILVQAQLLGLHEDSWLSGVSGLSKAQPSWRYWSSKANPFTSSWKRINTSQPPKKKCRKPEFYHTILGLDVNRIFRFRGLLQFPPPHSPKGLLQRHHAAVHFQVRLVPWSWRFAVCEPENHHDFMGESSENHLYMKHYHPFYRANS
jgi:hypothetical protein